MSIVGENILAMRKELGMTQEELAKKMGYKSKSTINKIELGINDIPQSKIAKFAEVLNTTPAYLMGWSNIQESKKAFSQKEMKLTKDEQMWLELYHKLSSETRDLLIETIGSFHSLSEDKQKLALQMLRVALKSQ